ncbi:MAG TPA: glycosyltransferase [Stellaceae bacterium]|jgi:glycosyltransferase involved in cell wall biosynthesis|nr:glycosyltransferase [Stellaceae bacterium]
MKLLQIMAGARHGGAEAFFTRLAIGLHKSGQEQRLVIRPAPEREATLANAGIAPLLLPFGGWLDFTTRPGLRRAISDYAPAIVLSWMNRATSLCPRGDFVHVARLGGYYDLKYYRGCDHLIANTRGIADYLRAQGWDAERVHYLPNFPATAKLAPVDRAAFDTPAGAPVALALGRLHPNKGFDVLIEALADAPGIYLWLAGEGLEGAALQQAAASLGLSDRVRFLGWREDIADLLAAADMLVAPSRIEPLGNTIIEAWAAQKPVIAASSDGPRELIQDNVTGLLVPVEDAVALAAALRRLAGDAALRARLAAGGHARYESEFGEASVIAAYRDIFSRVAA